MLPLLGKTFVMAPLLMELSDGHHGQRILARIMYHQDQNPK